jgi:hypothetical protein
LLVAKHCNWVGILAGKGAKRELTEQVCLFLLTEHSRYIGVHCENLLCLLVTTLRSDQLNSKTLVYSKLNQTMKILL